MLLAAMLIAFFGFMFLSVPMAFSIGLSCMVYILFSDISSIVFAQQMYVTLSSFSMMAVPLFILAGDLMNTGGLTTRILKLSRAFVGHYRGSLSQVCVASCSMFGAMSGSAVAACSCMGSTLIPPMKEEGYDEGYACAVTAASALLGPMIPPSIAVVIYGTVTGTSIPKLLMACLAPATIMIVGFVLVNYITAKRRGYKPHPKIAMKERLQIFVHAFPALVAPLIIIGGIFSGIFTATEAGAVAAVYAFLFGIITGELKFKDIKHAMATTTMVTAAVLMINAAAGAFSWVLTRENVPSNLTNTILQYCNSEFEFLLLVIIFLLILGCFLTDTAITPMCAPLFYPIALAYGIDSIAFGCFWLVMICMGALTPPVGSMLFVSSKIGETPISKVVKNIWPFVIVMLLTAIIVALFPQFPLFFANLVR